MKVTPGGKCWIVMATGIAAMDVYLIRRGHATMSECFGQAVSHPRRKWFVIAAWGYITLHLFGGFLPPTVKGYDPLGYIASLLASQDRESVCLAASVDSAALTAFDQTSP